MTEGTGGRSVKVRETVYSALRSAFGSLHTEILKGSITDYGSSMVQWMRSRQPRYKAASKVEFERPSPSYIVDVRDLEPHALSLQIFGTC